MSEIYRTPDEILADMLAEHKSITGVSLKPTDLGREEVIKYAVFAGFGAALLSQAKRVFNDFFPASASEEGLRSHLRSRQLDPQKQPQKSAGIIRHTGTDGTLIGAGAEISRDADGAVFVATSAGVIGGGFVDISYQSVETGAALNLDDLNQSFTMLTAIPGADVTVYNQTKFLDGRDLEAPAEMLARIEAHDRNDNTGGNLAAYEEWARESSPSVVTAKAIKNPRGANTVDTVITSGTTDIEAAVRAGEPVTRLPGDDLIALVQAYVLDRNPVTDDYQTVAPAEEEFNATVRFDVYDESSRPAVEAEITILTKIFIYQARSATVLRPTDLERRIDASVGHLLQARRVADFSAATDGSYTVASDKILKPGEITTAAMSDA